ncbi:TrmH family RNA methyltransferase [Bradyrhizobium sp. OAE829]
MILVEPQLGENIGMAARAMGNFALSRLRIVNPRDGWPNIAAQRAAAGADQILESAELFDTVEQAVADLTLLFATTARAHDQAKPVVAPSDAAVEIAAHVANRVAGGVGIMFGRERYGLQNEEVALANRIITFPVNPGFASLNLAQAVLLIGYEWFKLSTGGALPFAMPERSEPASQHQMQAFFDNLVRELDRVEFLRPPEKRETMLVNMRNIFTRMDPTKQDMHTLHGVVMAIAEGRKGPAKGGVLDGEQATRLRALLAEHRPGGFAVGQRRNRPWAGPVAAPEPDRRRADAVAVPDPGPPLRRAVQAPDPGRPPHPGLRLLRAPDRDRAGQPDRVGGDRRRPRRAANLARGPRLPGGRDAGGGCGAGPGGRVGAAGGEPSATAVGWAKARSAVPTI